MNEESIMLNTPGSIAMFRLLSLKYRLKIELAGIKFRGGSTFAYVKREFGLKGNKQKVYDQFAEFIEQVKSGEVEA